MRGEITDFKDSLRRRVALLKGVTVEDMERVYRERLRLNPGAAGLSVAYHAKPKVREQAMVAINEGGLDRLLELMK